MKKLLLSVVVLASLNSFAGPEEHIANQTCYTLKDVSQVALATSYVPTQICLEEVTVNSDTNTISVYSYFMSDLFKNLKLNYFARKNEDGFRFRASSNLATEAEVSAVETVTSDLLISGITDNYLSADVRFLDIQVKQTKEKYKAVGHTITETTVFEYVVQ